MTVYPVIWRGVQSGQVILNKLTKSLCTWQLCYNSNSTYGTPRKRNRLLEESKYQYVGKRQKKSCNSDLYRMLELPTYICYVWLTAIHVLRAILVGLDLAYLVDPRGKYNPRPSKKSKNLFQLILVFLDHYTVCESVELLRKPCSLKQKVQGLP